MRGTAQKFTRAIRLLPVLVVASVLLLTVRVGELTTGFEIGGTTVALAEPKSPDKSETLEIAASDGDHAAATSAATSPEEDDSFDPVTRFTDEELEILQELSKRRVELVKREEEIEARSRLLDAAEARIDTQIAELQKLRTTIESLVREYDAQESAELESVVKIYETMKPKDAARILGELNMPILLGIMERMKERKTAPILAAMDNKRARAVTAELARRKAVSLTPAAGG